MNKLTYLATGALALSLAALSLSLVACGKSSTVSGTVKDPFTGKAVELPKVVILKTSFTSEKVPGGLKDGTFSFEGVKPGTYQLNAGRTGYVKSVVDFTVPEEGGPLTQDIYIYPNKTDEGLYFRGADSTLRVSRKWFNSEAKCGDATVAALRQEFTKEGKDKKKDKMELAPATEIASNGAFLYLGQSAEPEATVYPAVKAKASAHSDCAGLNAKESLVVPDLTKGQKFSSKYISENLFELDGQLSAGKQLLVIKQGGTKPAVFYLDVK
jgi:hypothetical protein